MQHVPQSILAKMEGCNKSCQDSQDWLSGVTAELPAGAAKLFDSPTKIKFQLRHCMQKIILQDYNISKTKVK